MKSQLLALSLIASPALFTQADASVSRQAEHQNSSCNECCSTPCCCQNPRPSIDRECYVPQFYNLQCDWGLNLDVEFLYWYARETNLSYATEASMVVIERDPAQTEVRFQSGVPDQKHFGTNWRPGFRIGIGFNSCYDGWEYNLTWTWYQNKRNDSASVEEFNFPGIAFLTPLGSSTQSILINPWVNAAGEGSLIPTFDRIAASYRLRFNQIDFDLGRKYWLSKCFNMRPYIGLRGFWTNKRFATTSTRNASVTTDESASLNYQDRFRTKSWGVGFIGGIEPTWYFSTCFALFGQVGSALLWGDFDLRKQENYVNLDTLSAITRTYADPGSSCHSQMTAMLDLALGLRWERTWCYDRYRTALDLGWEHHILFDQNHRFKTFTRLSNSGTDLSGTSYFNFDENTGNLGFGGLVLRLNWDF